MSYDYKDINIINEKARFYANELWSINFDLPVLQNNKIIKCLGRFVIYDDDNNTSNKIEISGEILKNKYNELTVDSLLLHELCHWYCYTTGKNHYDSSSDFIDIASSVGASLSGEIKSVFIKHFLKCTICNKKYQVYGYKPSNTYSGLCCGKRVVYDESAKEEISDTYIPSEKLIKLNKKFKKYKS